MKNKFIMSAAVVAIGLLSACAQQEEPAPIMIKPEPVYDKYGNMVHSGGYATKDECMEHHESHHCRGLPE